MKTVILIASLLAAGTFTPAFASENTDSATSSNSETTLEDLLSHSRVTVGQSREGVLTEMRAPNLALGENVWVYTGFNATNVSGGERYDALIVAFKDNKVATVRLAQEEQVRVALTRSGLAQKIAKR